MKVTSNDGKNFHIKDKPNNFVKVGPSESMSKSKKNTIDPEKMISNLWCRCRKIFILSDSPPEKDIQWSESGMSSSFKFIQKFWLLNNEMLNLIKKEKKIKEEIEIFTNQCIDKINFALEKFRYNVIIATFMKFIHF